MPSNAGPRPPQSPERPASPHKQHRDWHDVTSIILIGATFLAALAAAIGTGRQAYLGNKQLRAARDTLEVAQDQERQQLRAYVGIKPGEVRDFGIPEKQIVALERKNFGQTPAYSVGFVSTDADIFLLGARLPQMPQCASPKTKDQITIFPSASVPMYLDVWKPSFTKDMMATIAANESHTNGYVFIYYGTLCYKDAFNTPHFTDFCYMYHGKRMNAEDAAYCFGHNDSN